LSPSDTRDAIEINGTIHTFPPALGPAETAIINALKDPNPRHLSK
jgi:hypothetical protein